MPLVWYNYSNNYWGDFSKAKYRLLLDATEIKQFDFSLTSGDVVYIISRGAELLAAYNAANPTKPLLNDNGFPLRICGNCP
ncbi:hypothetical protein D3C87_2023900 [compost metagenome]